ncbi:hypothetical protein H4696_001114 [Amycolatopsis lexingtonensis]|uniref:Uncharacterized protein n=1 Tax=Amycolatopsis lexingtonensis TaxID=218822 RepID=A0ABR9HSW0_9PSEU|nr:hypothetical protein [Amycolatopsis lexingtonensis]MBE1494014.1 hypothetical protein [Amycolatopsis lexingtonensis]
MVIGLVIGIVVLVLLVGRVVHRRRAQDSGPGVPPLADAHAVDQERALTARLLSGQLAQDGYRDAMARLAAGDRDRAGDDDVALLLWRARLGPAGDDGARDLLDRLGATLPGVLPGVLCTAAVLASTGAGTDELMRTLHLSRVQARTVIDAVTVP